MASEILDSKASYKDALVVSPVNGTVAVKAMDTFIVYSPIEEAQKIGKISSSIKKVLKVVDTYPAEIFLGTSIAACLAVVTGGTAIPVVAAVLIAVALW